MLQSLSSVKPLKRAAGASAVLLGCLLSVSAHALQRPSALSVCDDVTDPLGLDPQSEFGEKTHTLVQQIFDGLVRFDPNGRIEPALATSWRRIDDKTMEFKLREGVVFHNGETFDAEAVKFTIERYLDPKTRFPAAGFLNSIDQVLVVDPRTVRITTKFPDGILLNRLAGFVLISPPRYLASHDAEFVAAHPVGTGAYRFIQWDKGTRIVLEANPDYWRKGYPKVKTLIFRFVPANDQVGLLLKGDLDVVTELPGTDTLRVMKSGRANVVKQESLYTAGASINISTGPLADRRVRQAINYAIDKAALIRYDLLGNGTPLATLTMPGEIGHNPDLRPYPYDPDRARRLLREAGYPKGLKLEVVVKAQGERTMKILSDQLKKVGILLDVHPTTDAAAINDIQGRQWDLTFGNVSDPMVHSFFVQSILLSSLSPFSIMRDPHYDELMGRMVTSLDLDEQQKRGMELDQYVYDQALSVFTYKRIRTYGVRKGIQFTPSVTGMPYFDRADISVE